MLMVFFYRLKGSREGFQSDVCFFYVCGFFSNLNSLLSCLSFQSDRLPDDRRCAMISES